MPSKIYPNLEHNIDNKYEHFSKFLFLTPKKLQSFAQFQSIQSTISSFICLHTLISVYFAFTQVSFLFYRGSSFATITAIFGFVSIFTGYLTIALKFFKITKNYIFVEYFLNLWPVFLSISIGLGILFQIFLFNSNACFSTVERNILSSLNCHTTDKLPDNTVLLMLVVPAVLCMLDNEIKWSVQLGCWGMNFIFLLFCIIYFQLKTSAFTFALYVPFTLIIMYSFRQQSLLLFLASEHLDAQHNEKHRQNGLAHVEEMRSLIGNMAHDLKTVSDAVIVYVSIFDLQLILFTAPGRFHCGHRDHHIDSAGGATR
jgi:hypothetical protein